VFRLADLGLPFLGMLLVFVAVVLAASIHLAPAGAQTVEIVVSSPDDVLTEGEAECPHEERCTLRKAIETANGDGSNDDVVIRFDPAVFPPGQPATIAIETTQLPAITRTNLIVDGTNAGIVLNGSALSGAAGEHGLRIAAETVVVQGLQIRRFGGACIHVAGANAVIGGVRTLGLGNDLDLCSTGIAVHATGAIVEGNEVGLSPGTPPGPPMATGIAIVAGDARIGHATVVERGNYVGNAVIGMRVGTPGDLSAATAQVLGNTVGRTPAGSPAPVNVGLEIVPPGSGVLATGNLFANVQSGIVIEDSELEPSRNNTLRGNRYANVGTIAIDFGPTGDRVPNDPGDLDDGPNGLQNHPEFDRATQSEITGFVEGPCGGCTVDLYRAERRGNGLEDVPTDPLPGTTVSTASDGTFVLTNPPVSPGDWVMAIVTDQAGNTSEFSEAIRVGTGIVQCGNEAIQPGWNALGYFGTPLALGAEFPPGSSAPGPVRSIHQLLGGPTHTWSSWFAGGLGDGLTSLAAGDAYWFWAQSATTLGGAFTLTQALPIELRTGWNEFVYIGAEDTVQNALADLDGEFVALFRYVNDGDWEGWLSYGSPGTPDWARGFDRMEPCKVYQILVTADATVVPPQP
jgi:hypothetical protein